MKFATLFAAVAATLSATVSTMPITDNAVGTSYVEARSDTAAGLFKRDEYCGTSTFKNETGPNSPKLDDCKRLMEDMRTYKTWTVNKGNDQRLAKYGNCRFVVDSVADNVKIGNFDIHDLVRDSITRYGKDGKVGAGGVMHCVAKGQGTDSIVWRVRT